MSNPNKTVAAARRKMGGFPAREPSEAMKEERRKFSEMVNWGAEQMAQGRDFKSMEEVEAAFVAREAKA